jgi:hypothetical protein
VEDIVKQGLIYALLAGLTLSVPAAAQGYEPGVLPPYEIMTMVRSTQFDPIGRPMRRGPNYLLRALDERDREVTLTISARSGQIMAVTPLQTAARMPPSAAPGAGEWQRLPPGYIAPPAYRRGAPIIDEDDDDLPPRVYGARPPAPMPGRPPVVGSLPPDDDDRPSSGPTVIPADPQQGGALPPPPERFPQRAAPAQPPKPVQRAAAAPPKTAPLPRPKPAAAAAPVQPAPAAPVTKWPESPAPAPAAKAPGAEETPH